MDICQIKFTCYYTLKYLSKLGQTTYHQGFPGSSDGKESTYNEGDPSLIPGLGRSLEKGMAAHSGFIALRIPWTEEPDGLYSP